MSDETDRQPLTINASVPDPLASQLDTDGGTFPKRVLPLCRPISATECEHHGTCKSPGKTPLTPNGLHDATTDPDTIHAWRTLWPTANMGWYLDRRYLAFDYEPYKGDEQRLAALIDELGELPPTLEKSRGTTSHHLVYSVTVPEGKRVRGQLGGIVLRHDSYLVDTGSVHASGDRYTDNGAPIAELPAAWLAAVLKDDSVGTVEIPADEPAWLAKISADDRVKLAREHLAKEPGEIKGTSKSGTTWDVIRNVIRGYAIRDGETALVLAQEYDAKCSPRWGDRIRKHVIDAYDRAHSPTWGDKLALNGVRAFVNSAPVISRSEAPTDERVRNALEAARDKLKRQKDPKRHVGKMIAAVLTLSTANKETVQSNAADCALALVAHAPSGATDHQLVTLLVAGGIHDQAEASKLVTDARALVAEHDAQTTAPDEHEGVWSDDDIRAHLTPGKEDETVANSGPNIELILRRSAEFETLTWDTVRKQIVLADGRFADENVNDLPVAIENWMRTEFGLQTTSDRIGPQLLRVARRWHSRNPIADYLRSLTWDRVQRIDTWLPAYGGAVDDDHTRRIGAMFLIGAVARALDPGCKMDNVLTLSGTQGSFKSQTAKALAGEWFSDTPLVLGNKDAYAVCSTKWIIELAELATLNAAAKSHEQHKAFLSSCTDTYRPPYGKAPEDFARCAVFIGSTNEDRHLTDRTGNRRHWHARVVRFDLAALRRDRDQLWAEAAFRYGSAGLNPDRAHSDAPGERWWLEGDEQVVANAANESVTVSGSTWSELIDTWVNQQPTQRGADGWTTHEIAQGALGLNKDQINKRNEPEIVEAIEDAGLKRDTKKTTVAKVRGYRWR